MRRIRHICAIALMLLAMAAPAAGATVTVGHSGWEWGNPSPQGRTLDAIEFEGARGYAAGHFGTVLSTDDGGTTLQPLGARNTHVDYHTLYVDPNDPKYYLIGCDGGVYESHDRGLNWHYKSNLPITQFYDVGVDQNPASGKFYHVYGGTQDNFTQGGPVRTRSANGITNADWYIVQGGDGFHVSRNGWEGSMRRAAR